MTAEVFLKRPHPGVPWGFRLIGGSDSHLPIIVSKVVEGSVAEQAGLEEDVLLERVNNVPTSGLTHAEVNQVILAAEDELLFTIRRVDLENLILASLNEEGNNSEISNILRQAVNKSTVIQEETELEELGLQKEFGVTMIIENNKNISDINRKKEDNSNKYQIPQNQGKKWTTFLQKPKNPKPRPKNQAPPIPKADQYRVIIKKQPKPTFQPKEIHQQEEKVEEKEQTVIERIEEVPMELEISVNKHVTEETEITVEEAEEDQYGMVNIDQYNHNQGYEEENVDYVQYESTESENISTDVTIENHLAENAMSLEEQLAAVQRQLQELAQLPSSIQETLAVVTQQLAHIVGEKTNNSEATDESEPNEDRENENATNFDDAECEETEEQKTDEGEKPEEDPAADVTDKAEMEDVQSDILSDICEEQEVSETFEEAEERIALELEQQRIEEEKQAKHQLVDEWNRKWPWCDATKKVYKINFLKYTPPPKNLGYLQQSEVYRLVHGMEPPVRGISLRSEKILAEQDYYTAGGN
ncbi:uncharacterized protein LOC123312366 isoform X2 [Coccinella septempunctata]|uniref:uncharacterized protein LOC123312366 isoform X2 n=1 Tax=Coccinella septempunctata TaxID=41139 RepID=UPI001D0984D2|nr:uncharacterized protein LOC123312366 isoform X2 [Coccinella septempunctata]